MHTNIKRWKCDECDYAHAAKSGLAEHKKLSHPKESDMNFCHLCTYKTPDNSALKKHIAMVHQKIKRFACDKCSSKFYMQNQLTQHIKSKYFNSRLFLIG